jgi:Domain of unknown function (DUF4177)
LTVIALRPIFSPQPTIAASHRYEYLVVTTQNAYTVQIQPELDKHAAEGWELVTAGYYEMGTPGVSTCNLIFRREAR